MEGLPREDGERAPWDSREPEKGEEPAEKTVGEQASGLGGLRAGLGKLRVEPEHREQEELILLESPGRRVAGL